MATDTDRVARKLGLLAASTPETTVAYFTALIEAVKARTNQNIIAPMVVENLSGVEVERFLEISDRDGLVQYLLDGIMNLQAAGCEFVAIAGNAAHEVYLYLVEVSPLPVVSLRAAAAAEPDKNPIQAHVDRLADMMTNTSRA